MFGLAAIVAWLVSYDAVAAVRIATVRGNAPRPKRCISSSAWTGKTECPNLVLRDWSGVNQCVMIHLSQVEL